MLFSIIFNVPSETTVITKQIVDEHATEGSKRRQSVKKVTIPKHIRIIDDNAFEECGSLEEVIFEQGSICTEIGLEAFSRCASLEHINLPNTIVAIHRCAFQFCSSLEEINLPQTLTEISACAFYECPSLEQIVIPNSITTIGDYAFSNCESLIYAYLPQSIQYIDERAFYNCPSLSVIAAPPHTDIHHTAFDYTDIIDQAYEQNPMEPYDLLQQRFDNHPLHQICYDPHITIESLTATIDQMNVNEYTNVDAFSMNALHILCSNPSVTDEMISLLVNACPPLRSMQTVLGTTPVILYIKSKYGFDINKNRLSLDHFLSSKILREDSVVHLLALDDEMQEELRKLHGKDEEVKGLYPFMEIVSNEKYSLESLYWLLREHPNILANLCHTISTPVCNHHNEIEKLKKQNRDIMKDMKKQNRDMEEMKKQLVEMEDVKKQLIDVRKELDELKEQNKAILNSNTSMKRSGKRERDGNFKYE